MDATDAQPGLGRPADRADLASQAFQADVQAANFLVQQRGFRRALHALAHPLEQSQLDAGFKRRQGGADRRGRHVQPPGSGSDAFRFVDGAKG
ncbi:hypothetical protein G6F31_017474 [Rhizopus arrhizus]|nr:hypothetical protein G6F31_017474 [Rhizopus arrhizus]